jgi:hypothetical protein
LLIPSKIFVKTGWSRFLLNRSCYAQTKNAKTISHAPAGSGVGNCVSDGRTRPGFKANQTPESSQITPNQGKSNQIKPLFFIPTPNSKILASEQ